MNGKHSGPKRMFTDQQEVAICDYYWTRRPSGFFPSYSETGVAFDCSSQLVVAALKRQGYPIRTVSEARQGRANKPTNVPTEPPPLCKCGCGTPVKWISKQNLWQSYAPGHYRPKALYHDADWLRREYCDNLHSLEEIASRFDVSTQTILKAMRKHGIQTRTPAESYAAKATKHREWDRNRRFVRNWPRLRNEIKDRDKWTCQHCSEQRDKDLHVHHIDKNRWNNHPDNLISLCAKCHHKAHGAR